MLSKDVDVVGGMVREKSEDVCIVRSGVYKDIKYTIKENDNGYFAETDLDDETFEDRNENAVVSEMKNWIDGHVGK
jgi:hypothetical protein